MMKRNLFFIILLFLMNLPLQAQQILIDRGVRAGKLWCFPLLSDSLTYLYLPHEARLGLRENNEPEFSLIRYALLDKHTEGEVNTITEADGGATLHFLVLYDTPEIVIHESEAALRQITGNEETSLRGPVIFSEGRYALISSILTEGVSQDTNRKPKMLAVGQAPVLEGSKIALSFQMDPKTSSLLLQSLQMPTPDVSLVFDMTFSGLTDSYQAELFVDWSQVRESKAFEASGSAYILSAQVELGFEKLFRENAIQLKAYGSNDAMEGLLNTVYDKLLQLLFQPIKPEHVPDDKKGDLFDAMSALIDSKSGPLSARKLSPYNLNLGYQYKEMQSEGTSTLYFNGRSTVNRHYPITFNIGNIYHMYGNDERYFKTANLNDPTFSKRDIYVGVDGSLLSEFDKLVNSVTVTLEKTHQNGDQTIDELIVNRQTFADSTGRLRLTYGSNDDDDRIQWLNYNYKTHWQFAGGGFLKSAWIRESASMINLFAPYERKKIEIIGDFDVLLNQSVRAIEVQITYQFFDEQRQKRFIIRTNQPNSDYVFEITTPTGAFQYKYKISWYLSNGERIISEGADTSGLLFIDEIPKME